MTRSRVLLHALLLVAVCAPRAQAMHFHRKPTSGHARKLSARASKRHPARLRGQQNIDPERAMQIQTALHREHYLNNEPNGMWDQASKDAMVRYQADHGWQTKVTPDSRALIKLGLGPQSAGIEPAAASVAIPAHAAAATAPAPLQAAATTHTLASAITAHSHMQNLVIPQ